MSNESKTVAYMRSQAEFKLEELKGMARHMARKLTNLADEVEKHGIMAQVPSLGPVQGNGSSLDILCAELWMIRQVLQEEGNIPSMADYWAIQRGV